MTEELLSASNRARSFVVERLLSNRISSRRELDRAKGEASRLFPLNRYLSNAEILAALPPDRRKTFGDLLRVHPRRSASGIVVVTAFSAPFACPHGTCTFCPGGPREGTPQSYVRESPGMKAALLSDFDPRGQVSTSLEKYASNGHDISKVEAIIEGGTFIAVPLDYQLAFVRGVFDGLNGSDSTSLGEAQGRNEVAKSRCVGLTLESKPDWCEPEQIDTMLVYGVTRLEIGVQSLRDEVLAQSNRGHTADDSIRAFRAARDAGLKVTAHMMPGLPGADPQSDLEDLERLFSDEALRPDMMKVYPTLVVGGTSLARQFEAGRYTPYDLETTVELLSEMKRFVPRWHRIMRIQREIPAHEILGGVRSGNLRELVLRRVEEKGFACNCIRCREVALADAGEMDEEDELVLRREDYIASGGEEVFCSYEYGRSGRVAAFVRMRHPSPAAHRTEMESSCIVRELKVYGRVVPLGSRSDKAWQHRGLGRSLIGEVEKVAGEELGAKRMVVTSAVGTRNYYRALGYERLGPYMAKALR
ncbi:MAG: tRNA uridine(34) 5-carboxymethylaminomethyl modification radical SAM/GNAT enzyme Elp3 [Thaumarchaeota archaeon]|nr:MAG: tRNA uridine(34) 5-carboxymethylaminomethyl modification radical SAM/GNAT enzyme Elp3 [Nitrososphaerota archaeon]